MSSQNPLEKLLCCSGLRVTQKAATGKSAEKRYCAECSAIHGTPVSQSLSLAFRYHCRTRSWRTSRANWEEVEWNNVLWTWQEHCTHDLPGAVFDCKACSAQHQGNQQSGMNKGGLISTVGWWLLGKGDLVVFKCVAAGMSTMLWWMAHSYWVYRQHKSGSVGYSKRRGHKIERGGAYLGGIQRRSEGWIWSKYIVCTHEILNDLMQILNIFVFLFYFWAMYLIFNFYFNVFSYNIFYHILSPFPIPPRSSQSSYTPNLMYTHSLSLKQNKKPWKAKQAN